VALALCAVGAAAVGAAPAGASAAGTAAVAWGDNYRYDLGAGYRDTAGDASPVSVLGVTNVQSVVAAGATSYALLSNGTIRAWGGGVKGQLGDGVTRTAGESTPLATARSPVTVLEQNSAGQRHELTGVKQVAASYGAYVHALALVENGAHENVVFTWGASEYGERANGEYGFVTEGHAIAPREVAVAISRLKHVVAIAAGGASSYAIKEEGGVRTVWAWGADQQGQLGIGSAKTGKCKGEGGELACVVFPTPVALPTLPTGVQVASIAAGRNAAYAVLSNGEVLSWGANEHGQLGNGTTEASSTPAYVCAVGATAPCGSGSRLRRITAVAGGERSALALTEGHKVVGWGSNGNGQLGPGSPLCAKSFPACQPVPKAVGGLQHVKAISQGASFSLALNEEGRVYSFGLNEHGQLGNGIAGGPETCGGKPCDRVPTAIAGLPPVGGISAGGGESGEGHSLVWLQSGSGPPPILTLTPGKGKLTIRWAFNAEEFRLSYRLAPESSKAEEKWSEPVKFTVACSVSSPCHRTIMGSSAQQYEVKLDSYRLVEEKRRLEDSHGAIATPK
jgi:alpha-tubulin suppressor-like RCC1 family protein